MTALPLVPRRRKARHEFTCGACGSVVLPGAQTFRWPGEWWVCLTCAASRAKADVQRDRQRQTWEDSHP